MRVIIKGADFSAVSIGKVMEDLSFEINKDNVASKLVNYDGTTASSVQYYQISNDQLVIAENANRVRTDYIEVIPGMDIYLNDVDNTTGVPTVVCFDSSKNPLGVSNCLVGTGFTNTHYTIPQGTKYIWVQMQVSHFTWPSFVVHGSMPEE